MTAGDHASVPVVARAVAPLLICVIAGLAPAAYADPPDPSWIVPRAPPLLCSF